MPNAGDLIVAEDVVVARLTANVTLATSSTTLQDVTGLAAAALANEVYLVDMALFAQNAVGTTEDIKYGFTFPTGAALRLAAIGGTTGGVSGANATDMFIRVQDITSGSTTMAFGVDTLITYTHMTGILTMSSTAGSLQVQAAQNTSGANAVSVRTGSYVKLTRI